jgi:iron complex outermembrane receptor protein
LGRGEARSLGCVPESFRDMRCAGPGLRVLASVLALHGFAAASQGQEPPDTIRPDTVFTVEGIAVKVSRPVATAGGASALTTPLDSVVVPPAPTLQEVLRRMPLVLIRENSRGEAQPQVRGMESRQVAVLVDGVPLTLGWDNRTDLSIVPLTAARQLTLVRGLSSVLHGPNALGGVVLVDIANGAGTLAAPEPFNFSVGIDQLGNGSAALGLATLLRGRGGDLLLRAGGGYRNRSSVPLASGITQPVAADDRLNSDFEHWNGYAVARYQGSGGPWASLSTFAFNSNRGVPPELHIAEPRLWRYPKASRWVTALSGGTGWLETPWGEGDLEASLGVDLGETDIDAYESLAYDSIAGGEKGDDRTLSLRLLGDHTLGGGVLRSAWTLAETRHELVEDGNDPEVYRQRFLSVGVETEHPIYSGGSAAPRARVSIGVSADYADTPETGVWEARSPIWAWGARAGGTYAIGDGTVLVNGGVSRRVRFPALRELYSGALGKFVVNPDLAPEVLGVAELGLTASRGAAEAQVVGFYQRLEDAIVRVSLADGTLQRQNRAMVRSAGVELLASYTWPNGLAVSGDATLKDVEQEDPSAPEGQQHPEYQPWISGGLALSVPLGYGVRTTGRVRHLGVRYCVHPDFNTEQRLASDTWLDVELGGGFDVRSGRTGRVEVMLAALNVTDEAVFDQCGLPQPGRLLQLQVRLF